MQTGGARARTGAWRWFWAPAALPSLLVLTIQCLTLPKRTTRPLSAGGRRAARKSKPGAARRAGRGPWCFCQFKPCIMVS